MRDALGNVQSVLVLGGGSDIAQATARKLVGRRATTVVLAGRTPSTYEPAVAELQAAGATTVEAVEFDALDTTAHVDFVDGVAKRFGDIDVVLLAFGVLGDQDEFDDDPAGAAEAAATNYAGAVSAGLAVAQHFREQGHGTLVVLSSVAGQRARRSNFVYGSSKAGLDAFAQGLGDHLVGSGARVMVVRPGFVTTKMTEGMKKAPFATDADAVADAIVAGIATGAETVWVPPVLRWVFAAFRLLPRAVWRRLPF
jgi:decaprenylphospho-beta-D-erythro-pentofuranosid-2-ulose 2-reductase